MAQVIDPVAPPQSSAAPVDQSSPQQQELESVIQEQKLDTVTQKRLRTLFTNKTLGNKEFQSTLDTLPLDRPTKADIWNAYFAAIPKPAPVPAQPPPLPEPPGILSRIGSAISSAANKVESAIPTPRPEPLPPPPVPAGVKPLETRMPGTSMGPGPRPIPPTSMLDKLSQVANAPHDALAVPGPPAPLPPPPGPSVTAPKEIKTPKDSQFFDTKLNPEEEKQFQQWKAKYAPKDSGFDYDLRGAFKAGITPDQETGHWPDTFKKPNHPTFSNESQYAAYAPDKAGRWGTTLKPEDIAPQKAAIEKGQNELSAMEPELSGLQSKIQKNESAIKSFKKSIDDLGAQIQEVQDSIKKNPSDKELRTQEAALVDQYNTQIKDKGLFDENADLVNQYKALADKRNKAAAQLNTSVTTFNAKLRSGEKFVPPLPPPPPQTGMPGTSMSGVPLPPQKEVGWLDTLKQLPGQLLEQGKRIASQPAIDTIKETYANVVKQGAGLLNAASLNYYDPELGKATIPVKLLSVLTAGPMAAGAVSSVVAPGLSNPTIQIHKPLASYLQAMGVPADVANNPDPDSVGKLVGIAYPWGEISKGVAGATGLLKAKTAADLAEAGVPKTAIQKGWKVASEILEHAGIQGATGDIVAHIENPPEGETSEQRSRRAGNTAIAGAAFSILFDGAAKLFGLAKGAVQGEPGTVRYDAAQHLDQVIGDIYDVFYRSGEYKTPGDLEKAVQEVVTKHFGEDATGVKINKDALKESIQAVEAERAAKAAGTPAPIQEPNIEAAKPAGEGTASAPEIPKVPEPEVSAPVPPPSKEPIEQPTTEPKSVVPEEVGIAAPKKQFTHDGQFVVGVHEGKAVLADGTLVDRNPDYMETLGKYGYKEVTPEQIATLSGLAAANAGKTEAAPEAVAPPATSEAGAPVAETPPAVAGPTGAEVSPPVVGTAEPQTPSPVNPPSEKTSGNVTVGADGNIEVAVPAAPNTETAKKQAIQALIDNGHDPKDYQITGTTAAFIPTRGGIKTANVRVQFEKKPGLPAVPSATGAPEKAALPEVPATVPVSEPKGTQTLISGEDQAKELGDRWTYNTDLGSANDDGVQFFLDGTSNENSNAAITKDADGNYYAQSKDGREMGPFVDTTSAARSAEKWFSQRNVEGSTQPRLPEPVAAPTEQKGELPHVPESGITEGEGGAVEAPASVPSPRQAEIARLRPLVDKVVEAFQNGEALDNPKLTALANAAFGGTRGGGKYDPKDAYDAVEAAINKVIESRPGMVDFNDVPGTFARLGELEKLLPRQTDRTEEGVEYQQFSTPPAEAFTAVLASGIKPGMVTVEPSAGTANIATMMKLAGATVVTNETAPRRQAILEMLGYPVHGVDAQYLHNLLDPTIKPQVIVMNPPFSSTGGRTKGHKTIYGAEHVEQALARVEPGGRVVAIVGRGMAYGRPAMDKWWEGIEQKYHVRANVGIDGKYYGKYGTGFDNQILVIDKTGPTPGLTRADRIAGVIKAEGLSPTQAADLLGPLGKEDIAERISQHAKPTGSKTATGTRSGGSVQLPTPVPVDTGGTPGRSPNGDNATTTDRPAGPGPVGQLDETDKPRTPVSTGDNGIRYESGELPGTKQTGGPPDLGGGTGGTDAGSVKPESGLERAEASKEVGESESETYSRYVVRKAKFEGAKPHPANIVESATMASVEPPDVTYTPKVPSDVVKKGLLSEVQLEPITYAGQRHQVILPNGKRGGYWIGDGTGLGKGREIAGILYDNLQQGKKRAVWFSATAQLKTDAIRDVDGIELPMKLMVHGDTKDKEPLPNEDGIMFSTYALAAQAWTAGQHRFKQLADWLGPDFDGVIVFDECFVWETPVLTEIGLLPIGQIVDQRLPLKVLSWDKVTDNYEWKAVVRWLPRKLHGNLVRVIHEAGSFVCTPNHRIWTEEGYLEAGSLHGHRVSLLPQIDHCERLEESQATPVLQHFMFGKVEDGAERNHRPDVYEETGDLQNKAEVFAIAGGTSSGFSQNENEQSCTHAGGAGADYRKIERQDVSFTGRQRQGNGTTAYTGRPIGPRTGIHDHPEESARTFSVSPDSLQRRPGYSGIEDRDRDRWPEPQNQEMEISGPPKDGDTKFSRVVCVEILEPRDLVGLGSRSLKNRIVYDIEVADNHNYFAAGVLVSNCHMMKNAVQSNMGGVVPSDTSKQEGTNSGAMGLALDETFPKAKIVYVSATGATVPRNMGYMGRLGMWGPGAPFPSFVDFLGAMTQGGVGAMEMLSRDLKATGIYSSRSISYKGVDYSTVEHQLLPEEIANYDHLADTWSMLQQAFDAAAKHAKKPKKARNNEMSAFYSRQQQFFLQVLTSLQLPDLFDAADKDLSEGRSVVVSLYSTNEGAVAKKVSEAKASGTDLEDIDFTPRELILKLVEDYFPIHQWTTKYNPISGKDEPVELVDEAGNPVINRENLEKRNELLDKLADIRVPDNPLDAIVNHFGARNVSEITGRKKRLEGGKYVARKIEGVPLKERDSMEVKRFQDGKTHVSVISGKASAGISLHASKAAANQSRRVFYAMQLSWSADKQMQAFGRVHRSDQVEPPMIKLMITDLKGQQRLVNTVAGRLASLGALTEGTRESKGGGLFALHDITDENGVSALQATYKDILDDNIPGVKTGRQLIKKMGLLNNDGVLKDSAVGNVNQFLNRIMALHADEQNAVFNKFYDHFTSIVNLAKEQGTFDEGVTKVNAENIRETAPAQVVHTDKQSGAKTSLVSLEGDFPLTRMPFSQVLSLHSEIGPGRAKGFHKNLQSGRLYSSVETRPNEYGETKVALYSPKGGHSHNVTHDDLKEKFQEVPISTAANLWEDEYKGLPGTERKPIYILNGAIFPIYDKVMGQSGLQKSKVIRAHMADGSSKIGIQVLPKEIESLKQRLGIGTPLGEASPRQIYDIAKNGGVIELDNGWEIKSAKIHGETRIELDPGAKHVNKDELAAAGIIAERINYSNRYFIPLDDDAGPPVVEKIIALHKPVRDKTSATGGKGSKEGSYYVTPPVEAEVPAPVAGPRNALSSRSARLPNRTPAPMLKPPLTVGDKTYEPVIVKAAKGDSTTPVAGWEIAPGLAVTPDLNDPKEFTVTHTVSGLAARTAIHSVEMAVRTARMLADIGDWTRAKDDIMSDSEFLSKVSKALSALKAERGAISFFKKQPPPPIPPASVPSSDSGIERLFDKPQDPRSMWQRIKNIPNDVYEHISAGGFIGSSGELEDVNKFPKFKEQLRRAYENPHGASRIAERELRKVLKGLHPVEFEVFRRLVYLNDLLETALSRGEERIPLEGPDQIPRISEEIQRLHDMATPAVTDAQQRHNELMGSIWSKFQDRDIVDENDEGLAHYYPNQRVRALLGGLDPIPGLPARMQNLRNPNLRERKGHLAPHSSDYIGVVESYITRAESYLANYDFLKAAAAENDVMPHLSRDQKVALLAQSGGQLRPGAVYMDDMGNKLKGFQQETGRVMYPIEAVVDKVIQDAVDAGMQELGIDLSSGTAAPGTHYQTPEGQDLTKTVYTTGNQRKVNLLPIEIANKLEYFREANKIGPLSTIVRAASRAFKNSAMTFAGVAHYARIAMGEISNLMFDDLEALAKMPEAMKILKNRVTPPQYEQLMQMIEDARIWNSTFMASDAGVPKAINAPDLRQYRQSTLAGRLNPFGPNPLGDFLRELQRKGNIPAAATRVAKYLADLERNKAGLPVKNVISNLEGIDPTSELARGKVAREFGVDMGALAPRRRLFYNIAAPFAPWMVGNALNWARRAGYKAKLFPGDKFLALVGILYISSFIWNRLMHKDVEEQLEDWQQEMFHINYGGHDKDGRPMIWAPDLPTDFALRWTGLHTIQRHLDDVLDGKITTEEAAKQQLQDIFGFQKDSPVPTAFGAEAYRLINPIAQVFASLVANRDYRTGKEIVPTSSPENLWGDPKIRHAQTDAGKKLQLTYAAKALISPYNQFLRSQQAAEPDSPLSEWFTETGPFAWKKALGIHPVNPGAQDLKDWLSENSLNQALFDEKMKIITDTYIEWAGGNFGDPATAAAAAKRDAIVNPQLSPDRPGKVPLPDDINEMQTANYYGLVVEQEQLRKAKDPETRRALAQDIATKRYQELFDKYQDLDDQLTQNPDKRKPGNQPYIGLPPVPWFPGMDGLPPVPQPTR